MDSDPVLGWLVLYKVATLASGCFFCLIGYKLFAAGHGSGESGVHFGYSRWNLSLTRVAPGVIFMLAGVGIIVATVARGIGVHHAPPPSYVPADLPPPSVFAPPAETYSAPESPSTAPSDTAPESSDPADNADALPPTLNLDR